MPGLYTGANGLWGGFAGLLYGSTSLSTPPGLLADAAAGFSPASLFANGEQGVWLDNSDFTTLFQDAAGTTPVTGYEQFVGLRLDKSKGLVLGPELVSNGTFDSNITGWTRSGGSVGSSASWSAGQAQIVSTGSTAQFSQGVSVVAGKTYRITANIGYVSGTVNGSVSIRSTNDAATSSSLGGQTLNATSDTTVSFYYTAASTTTVFVAVYTFTTACTVSADNISVRELPGNHAYQTTTTARAVLSARYNLLTHTEQFDNAAWGKFLVSVTPNNATAPDGTLTADTVTPSGLGAVFQSVTLDTSTPYVISVWARAVSGTSTFRLSFKDSVVGQVSPTFTATTTWQRFSFTAIPNTASDSRAVARDISGVLELWGADLRAANESPALPAYQRVGAAVNGTSTVIGTPDYDTVGFPAYLRYDGGDWYQTNSIDFSAGATNPPLGPELVTNGTFDTDLSGWSYNASVWSWSGGGAAKANFAASATLLQGSSVALKTYRIVYTVTSYTGGQHYARAGGVNGPINTGTGTFTAYVVASDTTGYGVSGGQSSVFSVDNVSVKEITDANYAPDKMSVFTGVRKLSDVGANNVAIISELSVTADTNNGTFAIVGSNSFASPTITYNFGAGGTTRTNASTTNGAYSAPITNIVTGLSDISGDTNFLRLNAIQIAASLADQGTGNFGNYPLYIGARAGNQYFFNGRDYGFVIVGRAVTASELTNTEDYMDVQTFGKNMTLVYSDELTTSLGELITAADGDQIYMTVQYV